MHIHGVDIGRFVIAVGPSEKSQRILVLFTHPHLMEHGLYIGSEANAPLPKAKEYTDKTICGVWSLHKVFVQRGSLIFSSSSIKNNAKLSRLVRINDGMMR